MSLMHFLSITQLRSEPPTPERCPLHLRNTGTAKSRPAKLSPYFEDRFEDGGKSKANFRRICEAASGFLTEVLRYGDEAFGLCSMHADKHTRRVDHTLLALGRHTSAYLDAVSALLRGDCVDGCHPLLRSMLEAAFGIAYIVEDRHEARGLAYQLVRIKRKIKKLRRADRTSQDGRHLETELSADIFVPSILGKMPNGLGSRADEIERRLSAKLAFAPILAEWDRLKHPAGGKRQPDPEWFTLFGGVKPCKGVRSLAAHLKWLSLYEFLYRDWSNSVHAGDAIDQYSTSDNCVRPLRYPAGYANVLSMAFAIFINGLERMSAFYNAGMGQQVRDHAVKVLTPRLTDVAGEIQKALEPAM